MNPYQFSDLFDSPSYPSFFAPQAIRFALLLNGYDFPIRDEVFRILEIGTVEKEWQAIHQVALSDCECVAIRDDFENVAKKGFESALSPVDLIVVNKAWTHATKKDREAILSIINTHLKVGGVVCIQYNVMPGCSSLVALRDLIRLQVNSNALENERKQQVLQALYFTDNYSQTKSAFFLRSPKTKDCLENIKKVPFDQLEKEWVVANWEPDYFSDMADSMASIRCQFLCLSDLSLQLDMCLPEETAKILHKEDDFVLKETIRDFGLNQLIRTDLFARGAMNFSQKEIGEALGKIQFCLTQPRYLIVNVQIPTSEGNIVFDESLYFEVIDALTTENYRPKAISDLQQKLPHVDSSLFLAILNLLVASGVAYPTLSSYSEKEEKACEQWNKKKVQSFSLSERNLSLASPVLGSGLTLSRMSALFLSAWMADCRDNESIAKKVLVQLKANQESLIDGQGKNLDDESSLRFLNERVQVFLERELPYLVAMKVITHS